MGQPLSTTTHTESSTTPTHTTADGHTNDEPPPLLLSCDPPEAIPSPSPPATPPSSTALTTTTTSSSSSAAATAATLYAMSSLVTYSSWWLFQSVAHIPSLFTPAEYDKTNVTEAIAKLQTTLTFLDTKIETMSASVDKYTLEAKRLYARRNTSGAMHQLRLKKMYEREIAKMDSLKFNLESNILHMESVGVMMETVSTIKETSHQFQVVSKHVDFAKLEDSIEEMFEQRDTSKDIESILHGMHDAHEFDEDELLAELETMVSGEDTGEPSPPLPQVPQVPQVPPPPQTLAPVQPPVQPPTVPSSNEGDEGRGGLPVFPEVPTGGEEVGMGEGQEREEDDVNGVNERKGEEKEAEERVAVLT